MTSPGSRLPGVRSPRRGEAQLLAALLLLGSAATAWASESGGWRNGGTGVVEGASPPVPGAEGTSVRWKTATSAWGNASPVRFGDQVCITEEPTTLACYDLDSGELAWSASNLYVDTLQGEDRRKMEELLTQLDRDQLRLDELLVQMSRLQAELRRQGPGSEAEWQVEMALIEMNLLRTRLSAYRDFMLAEDKGVIGYGTATPAVRGEAIYALFGNGVLSSFSPRGERLWSTWLGKQHEPMNGFETGAAASPLLADGVLVVPFGRLAGVEPATGELLWRSVEYEHFGTPTVARVDGQAVIVTPGGELLSPQDGAVIGPQLGRIDFVGPVAFGDKVYVIGANAARGDDQVTWGQAYQLVREADGRIAASTIWEAKLHSERSYATPLVSGDRIWLIYVDGALDVLDATSGEQLSRIGTPMRAFTGSPSATMGSGRVILGSESGTVSAFEHADEPGLLGLMELEPHLSTPLLDGERIYVRGLDHLYCIE